MRVEKTEFEGLLVLTPRLFHDDRGFFFESFNEQTMKQDGITMTFVQDNQSHSKKGVLRGMHFQTPPFAQTKLVRVLSGEIQDVVVDLRSDQKTFGKYFSINLSSQNNQQLLIPKGFAHGFLVLSDTADVMYKCDQYYHPASEGGINYQDSSLNIPWQTEHIGSLIVSSKDIVLPMMDKMNRLF